MKNSRLRKLSARSSRILAVTAILSGLWACSSSTPPAAGTPPAAAPDANGIVRQDVSFNFDHDPGVIIGDLFDLAYATATKYPNATAACFRVRIEGQDNYGKPKTVSPGTIVFDRQELTELRKYASADAVGHDIDGMQEHFGPVLMFIGMNTRSPYCKALQECRDWEAEKGWTYAHCPGSTASTASAPPTPPISDPQGAPLPVAPPPTPAPAAAAPQDEVAVRVAALLDYLKRDDPRCAKYVALVGDVNKNTQLSSDLKLTQVDAYNAKAQEDGCLAVDDEPTAAKPPAPVASRIITQTVRAAPKPVAASPADVSGASSRRSASVRTSIVPTSAATDESTARTSQSGSGAITPVTPVKATYVPNLGDYYPGVSLRAGEEGRAIVKVCITTSGTVDSAEIANSTGHPLLDEAALKFARAARFTPATSEGKPVATCVAWPIKFGLNAN
jgi:protein TonB